jgi:hypothetical protein
VGADANKSAVITSEPLPPTARPRAGERTSDQRNRSHSSAVEQIAQSGQIEQWLDAMATDGLRRWSANNRLLALLQLQERARQRPELLDDVHMMSFRQWDKEHGRRVIKGERAIWILAPRTRRIEEEAADGSKTSRTIVTGFTAVPVFNITQTEGPDLPRPPIRAGNGEVPPGVLTVPAGPGGGRWVFLPRRRTH